MRSWYDLSHTFGDGMPVPDWPGEKNQDFVMTAFRVEATGGFQNFVSLNLHCGTHVDAPGHYAEGRASIDRVPFERLMGRCVVLDVSRGPLERISVADLEAHAGQIREIRKVILRTGWEDRWPTDEYVWQYPYLEPDVGAYLVDCGVDVLGLDTIGPDASLRSGHRHGSPLHDTLLQNDVLIIENLTGLKPLVGRVVFLYALPLKIAGAFGAPARVVARELDSGEG